MNHKPLSWSRFDQETKSVALIEFKKMMKNPFHMKIENPRHSKPENHSWFCIKSTCNQLRLTVNLIIRITSIAINYCNTIEMICDCFCNICHKSSFYYLLQHPETNKNRVINYRATRWIWSLMVYLPIHFSLFVKHIAFRIMFPKYSGLLKIQTRMCSNFW